MMKATLTAITTFAIALTVFAFNAGPVMATGEGIDEYKCQGPTDPHCHPDIITELEDPDQSDNERDVADSDDEGSTSTAGATEQ